MSLSEPQIGELLEWFVNSSETRKKFSDHRKEALEKNHKWIQSNMIQNMSDEELESRFLEYFKSGGGRKALIQIHRDRIIRDKKQFRDTLLYLLDESEDIKERIDQVLEGRYHIEGFGQAILTSFLMDWEPNKYCLWDGKTDMGFSVLGWKVYENGDSYGTAYIKVLDSLQKLRDLRPEFHLEFDDIDLFLHTISAEDEGKKAVEIIKNENATIGSIQENENRYWIFQGNPEIYNVISALRDGYPKKWAVNQFKDIIKPGDKAIIWVTGKQSGCYALCTITSDLLKTIDDPAEAKYFTDKGNKKYYTIQNIPQDRVEIKIDYNLWNRPILKDSIAKNQILKDLKVGLQGTNFTATKEQYEELLKLAGIIHARKYWIYAPGSNAHKWEEFYKDGIMAIGWDDLGDLTNYHDRGEIVTKMKELYGAKNPKNDSLACWDFCNSIHPGDIIIPKRGQSYYLGYGVVETDYKFDDSRNDFRNMRKVNWIKKDELLEEGSQIVLKTLTDITKYPEYVDKLKKLIGIDEEELSSGHYDYAKSRIRDVNFPLNLILYGPPGTGKTYKTVNYALAIIENKKINEVEDEANEFGRESLVKRFREYKDNKQIEFITFHQNYSYEDFIQGLRPNTENSGGNLSFDLKDGIFKRVADRALNNYKANKQSWNKNQKPPFNKVFQQLIQPLLDGVEDEREIKMRKVSFYITEVTDYSIHFRKASGGTDHTLSIGTLAEMYEKEDVGDIQGLRSYYRPLLEELLYQAKSIGPEAIREDLKNYVIIIDEINRANISKVFGELITLIEPDKRYGEVNEMIATLPSGQSFTVPSNLYIIGTMNTADKSIALLDIALRRRFDFTRINPDPKLVRAEYIDLFNRLNVGIITEKGPDFQIGHSFFMNSNKLADIMNNKIIPLLYEYFMNDEITVRKILTNAGVITKEIIPGLYEFESYNA